MRRSRHPARAATVLAMLAIAGALFQLQPGYAANSSGPLPAPLEAEQVAIRADGLIALGANAPPAPRQYGSFARFGHLISAAQRFRSPFSSVQIDFSAHAPAGSAVQIDVRASADGVRWSEWQVDVTSGAIAAFDQPARFAQYRATLLGNRLTPTVRDVVLTPTGGVSYAALNQPPPVAPTFKIHATRMGMVGGRTANGYRIKERDHFVSLPSWRSLSSNGGSEYMVRVTYNGRSSVAPVYDVGPWNTRDDYWNEQRERYTDLKRGWPQDHAAYFDGYNKGRAEKGKVRFPTAIDIGDGVWWDDLGIKGDRAEVEVTFLWLGSDPLAPPPAPPAAEPAPAPPAPAEAAPAPPAPVAEAAPAPPAPAEPAPALPAPPAPPAPAAVVVDNRDPGFKPMPATWYNGPGQCGNAQHAAWTYSTPNPKASENVARWQPALAAEALYEVLVYVPDCAARKGRTTSARYLVGHRDGATEVQVNQEAAGGTWVSLGRFPFVAGEAGFVELRDVTSDSMRVLWYDAVKWEPVRG